MVNAEFKASNNDDPIAVAIEVLGRKAMDEMPAQLKQLARDMIPLKAVDSVGLAALRGILSPSAADMSAVMVRSPPFDHRKLSDLIAELVKGGHGLIMVMGKGGVGKTTIAAAIALGLVGSGKTVHLSTTDPTARLAMTLDGKVPGLTVGRINPKLETQRYVDKIVAAKSPAMTPAERDLLIGDLRSPCTEEVAVFHAFSHVVSQARSAFVMLDTAPTGCSLLLMDATGAYHRQMIREFEGQAAGRIVTPLAAPGRRLHGDHFGDAARSNAGLVSGRAAGRAGQGQKQTLRVVGQVVTGDGYAGSAASRASGGREKIDRKGQEANDA